MTVNTRLPEVRDKVSFRHWCQAMEIDAQQAACLLGISVSNVYKCLHVNGNGPISSMVMMTCELVNKLDKESRSQWVIAQLGTGDCSTIWPSQRPIIA